MCSMPRKPQRKPKPSASEVSGSIMQRRIVQRSFSRASRKVFVIVGIDGKQTGEDPRLHLLETRQRLVGRTVGQGDGVADRRAVDLLDAGDHKADFAGLQLRRGSSRLGREDTDLVHLEIPAGRHDLDLLPLAQRALHDAHQRNHAQVVVEPGIDDQRLQRRVRITLRRRNARDQLLQQISRPRRSWR